MHASLIARLSIWCGLKLAHKPAYRGQTTPTPTGMLDAPSLQRLIRITPGLCIVLRPDVDFTILAASEGYLQTSHTDESIFGRPLFEVFPDNPEIDPVCSRTLRASLARVLATHQLDRMPVVRYDVRRPQAEGGDFEERYWSPTNVPMLAEDGSLEAILHRVEEATVKSQRSAVEILESITEGFFTLDRQWRFGYVNAEAHRILGVEPGALAGREIWSACPGLEGTPFWDCYHQTMDERVKTSFTAWYANQARWYEVTVFPAPEGVSVYFRNATERKLQEARLAAMAELAQRLGDAADASDAAYYGAVLLGDTLGASRVGYGTVDHDSGNLTVERDWVREGVGSAAGVTPLLAYGSFIDSLRRGEFIAISDVRLDERTAPAAEALEARHARSFANVPVLEQGDWWQCCTSTTTRYGSGRPTTSASSRTRPVAFARLSSEPPRSPCCVGARSATATWHRSCPTPAA